MGNPGPKIILNIWGRRELSILQQSWKLLVLQAKWQCHYSHLLCNSGCCCRNSNKILSCPQTMCNLKKFISCKLFIKELLLLVLYTLKQSPLSLCNRKTMLELHWTIQISPINTHCCFEFSCKYASPNHETLWESRMLKKNKSKFLCFKLEHTIFHLQ